MSVVQLPTDRNQLNVTLVKSGRRVHSSIWRIQIVSGFQLVKIWATNSKLLIKWLIHHTTSFDRTA